MLLAGTIYLFFPFYFPFYWFPFGFIILFYISVTIYALYAPSSTSTQRITGT